MRRPLLVALLSLLLGVVPLLGCAQAQRKPGGAVEAPPAVAGPGAGSAGCVGQYFEGVAPTLRVASLGQMTRVLCSPGHVVLHSGVTRTALWSAEHLTSQRVSLARDMVRTGSFAPDMRLPAAERAELADYARSGYDRGHLAPNGDMADPASQQASFLLSNMVPQVPAHNRKLWEAIERATRAMVRREVEAYVVTGPAFLGESLRIGRVLVPTHLWKAVYFPGSQRAGAWFSRNEEGAGYEVISIDELTRRVGVDPFPSLAPTIRARAAVLRKPSERRTD